MLTMLWSKNPFKAQPTIIKLVKKCCKYMCLKLREKNVTPFAFEYYKVDMMLSREPKTLSGGESSSP